MKLEIINMRIQEMRDQPQGNRNPESLGKDINQKETITIETQEKNQDHLVQMVEKIITQEFQELRDLCKKHHQDHQV